MKILFAAANYYPHIGGVEKHLRELSAELSADGHQVTIVVEKHDPSYPGYEKAGIAEVVRLERSTKRFVKSIYRYWQIARNCKRILAADVVHFHDFSVMWGWLPAVILLKLLGRKVFITFHGWEGDCPPRKKILVQRKICELLCRGNICVGDFITKWYGTKADSVIYGGVTKAAALAEKEDLALFVGRLASDTGILQYLSAWKMVSAEFPALTLVVCGDGPLRSSLVEYLKREEISNVSFAGFVEDVESYLARAKVVFTSGYLGILEAFSYATAVVAIHDNRLKKDYLEMMPNSDGMMWIAGSAAEVAASVREALSGSDKMASGYRFSLANDWGNVKKAYYELWDK